MPATKSSSCLCQSVELTVTGDDKGAVLCHCSNCQHSSGSAFAHNHRFMKAEMKFTRGEDLVQQYADTATASGNAVLRHFCSKCGSPLFLTNAAFPGLVVLSCGSIKDQPAQQPSRELFANNKRSWIGEVTQKSNM